MKKYQIIISPKALDDLSATYYYIAEHLLSPQNATAQIGRIQDAIFSLDRMPERHSRIEIDLLKNKELRRMPVDNYIIIYAISECSDTVEILRILYGARDMDKVLYQ